MEYPVYYAVVGSLKSVWIQVLSFLPSFIGAVLVLIAGVLVAKLVGKIIKTIVTYTKADGVIQKIGLMDDLHRMGLPGSFSSFIGAVAKWFLIIITLLAVVDILHIDQLSLFLKDVLNYLPQVVVAIIVLGLGVVVGKILQSMMMSHPLATLAKWSVIIFSLMAALVQLGIASSLIQILFTGIVVMFTIAGGLAFGLGGRDKAKEWLERLDQEIKK